MKASETLKEKVALYRDVYQEIGDLRPMLWWSFALVIFQAFWTGAVLSALGAFLQIAFASLQNMTPDIHKVPSAIRPSVAAFLALPEKSRLYVSFSVMGLSMVLSNFIKIGVYAYQGLFSTRFIYEFRQRVFLMLCRQEMAYFDTHKKGEIIQMMMTETRAHLGVVKAIQTMAANLFNCFVILAFAMALSVPLCMVVVAVWVVLVVQNHFLGKTIRRMTQRIKEGSREVMVLAEEGVGFIKHIKLLNHIEKLHQMFSAKSRESEFTYWKADLLIACQDAVSFVGALVGLFIIVAINFRFSLLSVSSLILFMYALYRLIAPITVVNQNIGSLNQNLPLVEGVHQFLHEGLRRRETGGSLRHSPMISEAIRFDRVFLDYENRKGVLKDVSLTVNRGQTFALVGPSGAGKTSLANLLVRLYRPSAGTISFDQTPIEAMDLGFLRERVGMVHQETAIFNMSVADNLRLSRPDADLKALKTACALAYADEFIEHLPQQYDTLLGDRGVQLSGGQRQRLHIAQIFLKDPEVLILDEATSALDTRSEQFIQEALARLCQGRTTLVIAHRLSTIRRADQIAVIDQGQVVESGPWDVLMAREGVFSEMVRRQSFVTEPLSTITVAADAGQS